MPIEPSAFEKLAADCERLIPEAQDEYDFETLTSMAALLRLRAERLRKAAKIAAKE
jgi:hypothetical protein